MNISRDLTLKLCQSLFLFLFCASVQATALEKQQPIFENSLTPFVSDGCSSIAPDGTPRDTTKWQTCCVAHDIKYWMGGTWEDRKVADEELRTCIKEKSGSSVIAQVYYAFVRMGGTPAYKTSYRWGYGWIYDRGYKTLDESEQRQVHIHASEIPRDLRNVKIASKPKNNLKTYPMRTQSYCQDEAEAHLEKVFGPFDVKRVNEFTKKGEKFIKFRISACKGSIRFGFGEDLYQCTTPHYKNTPPKLMKTVAYFGGCKP